MNEVANKRMAYIDAAKGIAIILVVLGHVNSFNLCGTSFIAIDSFVRSFHMPLFFFLSGYVSTRAAEMISKGEWMGFIQKKARSLLIPFLVWGCVVSVLLSKISNFNEIANQWLQLFRAPDVGLWFLVCLFTIQLNFMIVVLAGSKFKKKIIPEILALVVMFVITWGLQRITNDYGGYFYFNKYYNLAFFAGYYYKTTVEEWLNNKKMVYLLLFIFFVVFSSQAACDIEAPNVAIFLSLGISSAIILITALKKAEMERKESSPSPLFNMLSFIGQHTLEIYATHFCIINILYVRMDASFIHPIPLFILLAFISTLIAVLIAIFADLLERIPYVGFFLYGKKVH